MPDFPNLVKALMHVEIPSRVPLFDIVDVSIMKEFLGLTEVGVEDYVRFYMDAGYDYVPISIGIRQIFRAAPHGMYGFPEVTDVVPSKAEGAIASRKDIDAFEWPSPDSFEYSVLDEIARVLPPEAKVITCLGWLFMATWKLLGFDRFCISLFEDEELVAQIADAVARIQEGVLKALLDYECVGAVWMPDDFAYKSGPMVSPKVLRQLFFPWYRRYGENVHSRGIPYLVHSDGNIWDLMDDFIGCGFDAVNPFEPAAIDIRAVRRKYGQQVCLLGNVDVDLLIRGQPVEIEQTVRGLIRDVGVRGAYCCGSGNSVSNGVPFANYMALRDSTMRYGAYPIALQ